MKLFLAPIHLHLVLRFGGLLAAACVLAGCAGMVGAPTPQAAAPAHWQGRMAIKVFSVPVKTFAADFVLSGNPEQGELTLMSPLGNTLAQLQWAAGAARLKTVGTDQPAHFESLDSLVLQTTGTTLPVTALFAWLQGGQATATGWEVELENIANGRLIARQLAQEPQAELKIFLER